MQYLLVLFSLLYTQQYSGIFVCFHTNPSVLWFFAFGCTDVSRYQIKQRTNFSFVIFVFELDTYANTFFFHFQWDVQWILHLVKTFLLVDMRWINSYSSPSFIVTHSNTVSLQHIWTFCGPGAKSCQYTVRQYVPTNDVFSWTWPARWRYKVIRLVCMYQGNILIQYNCVSIACALYRGMIPSREYGVS